MQSYDVVTVGAAVLDIFMRSDKFQVVQSGDLPGGIAMCQVYGGKMEVEEVTITSGGGATNTAVSFAKKELKTAIIAEMGNDPQALLVHKDLEEVGVETRYLVQEADETTAVSVILIAHDGGRSIMVHRGAAAMLDKTDIPLVDIETRWLYISSLGGNMELLTELILWAKQKHTRVALNPGLKEITQRDKLIRLLKDVELVFVNREEAKELWGIDFSDDTLWKSTQPLPGAYGTVITDGARGGKISLNGKVSFYKGEILEDVVDSTGAGDAFASGYVAAVAYGKTYDDAIQWGMKNAMGVLRYVGAKKGLLTLSQISR